jgi:deoxyribonuclease-4
MIIGGHVSIAGGLSKAAVRAAEQGFDALQIFASAPQSFRMQNHSQVEINEFNRLYKEYAFQALFFHAIYLLNLASEKEALVRMSIDSLVGYMNFGEEVSCNGTIVHIGSYKERGFDAVSSQLVSVIKEVLEKTPASQFLLIENAAGGGGRVGAVLEELVFLHKKVNSPRLKFCIDTQHLFATGVDVTSYDEFNSWLTQFDQSIGIEKLTCLHMNDSKTELGSKKDRHENIGKGFIGVDGFKNIARQPLLQYKPFILEVPGMEGKGPDRANMDLLRSLA